MKLKIGTTLPLYARQIRGIVVRHVKSFTITADPLAGRHPHRARWRTGQGQVPLLSSPEALRVASRGLDRLPPKGDGRGVCMLETFLPKRQFWETPAGEARIVNFFTIGRFIRK